MLMMMPIMMMMMIIKMVMMMLLLLLMMMMTMMMMMILIFVIAFVSYGKGHRTEHTLNVKKPTLQIELYFELTCVQLVYKNRDT
jgi:hypothetical protein